MGDQIGDARMRRRLLASLAALLCIAALLAVGCGSSTNSPAQAEKPRFTYARALFREICAGCHRLADAGAQGDREPLDTSNLANTSQRELLAKFVIENGDSIMPSWKGSLTDKERNALVRYLSSVTGVRGESGDGKAARILTPRPESFTPTPPGRWLADGKALFKEMCAGCHALADADAHGTRVDLDAALAPVRNRAAVIRHALRDSPAMPDWTVRLRPDEIDSLVRYLSEVAGRGR